MNGVDSIKNLKDAISIFCKKYKPSLGVIRKLNSIDSENVGACIDIIHEIIFSRLDKNIDEIDKDILLLTIPNTTKDNIEDIVVTFIRLRENKTKVNNVYDVYILYAYLKEKKFPNIIIERFFIDEYLPYKYISVPYNRDEVLKARYTSEIRDDMIYVNVPGSISGRTREKLDEYHIELANKQKNKK